MSKTMAGIQQGNDAASGAGTPERILIVDDSEPVRKLIFDILTTAGYECRAVISGREALALFEFGRAIRFDAVRFAKQSAWDHFAGSHPAKLSEKAGHHIHCSLLLVHGTIRRQKHGSQRHSVETLSCQSISDHGLAHAFGSFNHW